MNADGRDVGNELGGPKRMAILAFLAANPSNRPIRRDSLLAQFWPELDDTRARRALRQALHGMRSTLGRAILNGTNDEEITVDTALLWCDAVEFRKAVGEERHAQAMELYRGDFLEGFHLGGASTFDSWLDTRRLEFRSMAASVAWAQAEAAEREGQAVSAAHLAHTAFAFERDDETALQRLVIMLDRVGDRAGALREYERFAQRMDAEYDSPPSPETAEIANTIRARRTVNGDNHRRGLVASSGTDHSHRADEVLPPDVEKKETQRHPQTFLRHIVVARITTVVMAIVGVAAWLFIQRDTGSLATPRILVTVPTIVGQHDYEDLAHVAADWIISGIADVGRAAVVSIGPTTRRYAPPDTQSFDSSEYAAVLATMAADARADMVLTTEIAIGSDSIVIGGSLHDLTSNTVSTIPETNGPGNDDVMGVVNTYLNATLLMLGDIDREFVLAARSTDRVPAYSALRELLRGKINFTTDSAPIYFARAAQLDRALLSPRIWFALRSWAGNRLETADSALASVAGWQGATTRTDGLMRAWLTQSLRGEFQASHAPLRALAGMYADDEWLIGTYTRSAMVLGHFDEAANALQTMLPQYDRVWHVTAIQLSTALHLLERYEQELAVIRRVLDASEREVVRRDIVRRLRSHEVRALAALGRTEELTARVDAEAERLELRDWQLAEEYRNVGMYLLIHGQQRLGEEYYERAVSLLADLEPTLRSRYRHHELLTNALSVLDRTEEAHAEAIVWLENYPESIDALVALGETSAQLGDIAAAESVLTTLEEDARTGTPSQSSKFIYIATLNVRLGRHAEAGRWLVAAFNAGHPRTGLHELEWSIGPLEQFSAVRNAGF